MWNSAWGRIAWSGAALSFGAAGACRKAASQSDRAVKLATAASGTAAACRGGVLRPSAIPPAEGVWTFIASDGNDRIAVMLGPTELRVGSTVVTRSVEAIETRPQGGEFRSRLDTAVVRLDLLPSYRGTVTQRDGRASVATQPTAIYAITPRVLIAAYEPCLDDAAPAIRYLRRDERGQVVVDAMLRRETEPRGK